MNGTTLSVTPETLPAIMWQNKPVITTELLASVYGTGMDNINKNFERNKSRFIEGVHYFLLKGADLKAFKNCPTISRLVQIGKRAAQLYLWTERGTVRHAKILDTDNAWEVQERLEDFYFSKRDEKPYGLKAQPTNSALSEILSANLSAQQKIILLIIGKHADENGVFQISLTELAPLCGVVRCTLSDNLNELETAGYLTITKTRYAHGGSQPNIYTIPERFRIVSESGDVVEAVTQKTAMQQTLPMTSIPDDMVMISVKRFMDLEKMALPLQLRDLKHIVEQSGGLVLTKPEVDRLRGVLKA